MAFIRLKYHKEWACVETYIYDKYSCSRIGSKDVLYLVWNTNTKYKCKILKKKYFSSGQKSKKELKSESPQGTCLYNKYF